MAFIDRVSKLIAKKHGTPFAAELKPSKKLQRLYISTHLIAIGASLANALPMPLKLVLLALIVINYAKSYQRLNEEQRKIRYTEKQGWQISERGEFESVTVLTATVLTTTFIFLHLHNKPAFIIANDALPEDEYRQLIVKLKMTIQ
jgi:toxin CptA